jgi:hypothetical protein
MEVKILCIPSLKNMVLKYYLAQKNPVHAANFTPDNCLTTVAAKLLFKAMYDVVLSKSIHEGSYIF